MGSPPTLHSSPHFIMTGILNQMGALGTSSTRGIIGDLDMIRGNGLCVTEKESNSDCPLHHSSSGLEDALPPRALNFKLLLFPHNSDGSFYIIN